MLGAIKGQKLIEPLEEEGSDFLVDLLLDLRLKEEFPHVCLELDVVILELAFDVDNDNGDSLVVDLKV